MKHDQLLPDQRIFHSWEWSHKLSYNSSGFGKSKSNEDNEPFHELSGNALGLGSTLSHSRHFGKAKGSLY